MIEKYPITDHFDLREFIDPITWAEFGEKSKEKIDNRLFKIAELLRTLTGKPITINNWFIGGVRHESGTRRQDTTTGAKHSAHKFDELTVCKAIDCVVFGMQAEEVHKLVLEHEKEFYDLGVRQMEDIAFSPTWTHLSTRLGIDNGKIQIIKP